MTVVGQAAEERIILREVNDRVHDVLVRLGTDGEQGQYLCECAKSGCLETVQLYSDEYEAIRSSDGLVVAAGHATSRPAAADA